MVEQLRCDLEAWISLIGRGSTTCPEEPHHPRSECHAWSALPLYAFMHTLAGIRQENGVIVIRPHLLDLPDLSGSAATPLGIVRFAYRRTDDGAWQYQIRLPENVDGLLITPSDKRLSFTGELQYAE